MIAALYVNMYNHWSRCFWHLPLITLTLILWFIFILRYILMITKTYFLFCLIIAQIFDTLIYWLMMSAEMALLCSLITALVFLTHVHLLLMFSETALCCKPITTFPTWVFLTHVHWLLMLGQFWSIRNYWPEHYYPFNCMHIVQKISKYWKVFSSISN